MISKAKRFLSDVFHFKNDVYDAWHRFQGGKNDHSSDPNSDEIPEDVAYDYNSDDSNHSKKSP